MRRYWHVILVLICVMFIPNAVKASYSSWGTTGGGSVGVGCAGQDSCWPNSSSTSGNRATNGIRITLYELYNNGNSIRTVGNSYDFINDEDAVNMLKGDTGITYVSQKTGKLSYLNGSSFTVTSGSSNFGSNLSYLDFSHFLSDSDKGVRLDVKELFDTNNTLIENLFSNKMVNDLENYYFVVEPLTIIIYKYNTNNKITFYGTSYEHAKYVSEYGISASWQSPTLRTVLPLSLRVESSINENGESISKFLNVSIGGRLANQNATSHYDWNASGTAKRYKYDYVKNYSYGMYILRADGIIESKVTEETCDIKVKYRECKDETTITEETSKVCTLSNPRYFLTEYQNGNIYCTYNKLSTKFNDFYNTFNSSIRAGSYFSIETLKISTEKTCYYKSNDGSSNVSGWGDKIKETTTGNLKLKIGNLTYDLTDNVYNNEPVCNYSKGVCTLESEHTYNLNYLTNRFISISTMKQDDIITESNCTLEDIEDYEKCQKLNPNTIYNDKPSLTVPLNYVNGIYKYELDLNNSIINDFFVKRIANYTTPKPVKIEGKLYEAEYVVESDKKNNDLSFTCSYKVTQDQCEDENGNLVPCPVDDCGNLNEDECCINGKVTDCPKFCEFECCDSEGKEIECPGGTSVLGNIIYRPISLTNPFPGISGGGRLPGSNWNGIIIFNGKTYSASDFYIKYNRGYNDYEIYQSDPLYTIYLDADTINYIREYNKAVREQPSSNDYNDFDFTCENGEKCISNFLRGNSSISRYNRNLLDPDKSKCYSADSFDSCITRKGA